jgi:pyruvate/2-oxoglutarate dehydrogenase complex dihydrolipoamide acyltransferase (E2) component
MGLIGKNVDLGPPLRLSSWRKIALGTWRTVGDPSVYATLDLDIGPSLAYIEKIKAKTGQKITFTHFFGQVLGKVLEKNPNLNCVLRFGRLYPRKSIDIFFQVAMDPEGKDLSGIVIRNINRKSLIQICEEMQNRVQTAREKGDPDFKKMKGILSWIPGIFVRYLLDLTSFLLFTLNLWSPLFGMPRDPFGSVMITSVGSLGLDAAFAPLVPYSRVPFLIALGMIKDMPDVKNGQLTITKSCRICVTFDHRLIDGMHGSKMARTLSKILSDPETELGVG